MAKKDKSLLDDIPIQENGVTLSILRSGTRQKLDGIVGHCNTCGNPIYGPVLTAEESPQVRRSCSCHGQPKSLEDTIRTT